MDANKVGVGNALREAGGEPSDESACSHPVSQPLQAECEPRLRYGGTGVPACAKETGKMPVPPEARGHLYEIHVSEVITGTRWVVLSEYLSENVADFTQRSPFFHCFENRLHQVLGGLSSILQFLQGRLNRAIVPLRPQLLEALDLQFSDRGIDPEQAGGVGGVGLEAVNSRQSRDPRIPQLFGNGTPIRVFRPQCNRIQRPHSATHGIDLLDVVHSTTFNLVGQCLDNNEPAAGPPCPQPCFVPDDLLSPWAICTDSWLGRASASSLELVCSDCVPPRTAGKRLERNTYNIVLRLLSSKGAPRGLCVESEHHCTRIRRVEALFMILAHSLRAARNLAISSRKS